MTSEQPEIVEFGEIYAHAVTLEDAIQRIVDRVDSGVGGYVVTPNVDHICIAEYDEQLRSAYKGAFLSLPDGKPLIWMARLFGTPLPEKVSGSDLVLPLLRSSDAVVRACKRKATCCFGSDLLGTMLLLSDDVSQ